MLPLTRIQPIAERLLEAIQPHCEIARIAGGIRRQKHECHDIELVVIPKRSVIYAQPGLFDNGPAVIQVNANFINRVRGWGIIDKGKFDGRMMQITLNGVTTKGPANLKLDLFMPDPPDYYRQFVIRTGSADYVRSTITRAWLALGWCGSDKGLRLQSDCESVLIDGNGKRSWKCINPEARLPPVWKSEAELFDWLKVPMCIPKMRTV